MVEESDVRQVRTWVVLAAVALFLAALPHVFMIWFYSHPIDEQRHLNDAVPPLVFGAIRLSTWVPYHFARTLHIPPPFSQLWNPLGGLFGPESGFWSLKNRYLWTQLAVSVLAWCVVLATTESLRRLTTSLLRRRSGS